MLRCHLPLVLLCIAGVLGAEPKRDRHGDPLPKGAIARLGSLRLRPKWPVITGAFSPDGKFLATSGSGLSMEGVVTFWDTATGKEARRLSARLSRSWHGLRFSADGKSLILVGSDGCFRIVDAATGTEQQKFDASEHNALLAVDIARDGKTAVTTDFRGNIVVWDLVRGKRLLERKIPVNHFHWSDRTPFRPLTALTPDGKQLVLPHADCSLQLVNVASGEKVVAFEMLESQPKGASHLDLPTVAVSPDGRYLAYASTWIPAVLCDLKTGKILHPLSARSTNSMRLFFAPDSRSVLVHSGSAIHLFDTASGKENRKIDSSSCRGHPLALSPDGKTLALQDGQHALSLWDVKSGRQRHSSIRHVSLIQSIAFFPDGKRLVSSDQSGNLIVWDITSAQVLAHHESSHNKPRDALSVDADGKTVIFLSFNQLIRRWNPNKDHEASRETIAENPSDFILSSDGRTLAATYHSSRSQVRLHDLQGGKAARTIELSGNAIIRNLFFLPDSRLLGTGISDTALLLWNRDTGKLVREIKADELRQNPSYWTFAKDSRSVAHFDNASKLHVCIRELASGGQRLKAPLPRGAAGFLVYSPDGRFLACQLINGGILVLGTAAGKELARWQGPQGTIYSLVFSRDSRLLASGGGDGTILLWKVPDGEGLPATLKADEAAALWQALADSDAARASRALAGLAAAPKQAAPLIKERFPTAWKKRDAKQLARLIADLDDDAFKVRERATQELVEAGSDAAELLHKALANNPSPETKRRIERLLDRLDKGGSPERLRSLRAIEVLERIGTSQARDLLRELNTRPLPAELHEDIEASLQRMDTRLPAASERSPTP